MATGQAVMYDCHVILRQRMKSSVRAECAQMDGYPTVLILLSFYVHITAVKAGQ